MKSTYYNNSFTWKYYFFYKIIKAPALKATVFTWLYNYYICIWQYHCTTIAHSSTHRIVLSLSFIYLSLSFLLQRSLTPIGVTKNWLAIHSIWVGGPCPQEKYITEGTYTARSIPITANERRTDITGFLVPNFATTFLMQYLVLMRSP